MKLLDLVSRVCCDFDSRCSDQSRIIQKVKSTDSRDVVTGLDITLHNLTYSYIAKHHPSWHILSEEDEPSHPDFRKLRAGDWLIVDPLDGSSNYSNGLSSYGYMATLVSNNVLNESAVVLPEEGIYLLAFQDKIFTSQALDVREPTPDSSIYYAYSPNLSSHRLKARDSVLSLIDKVSGGVYRYGSCCHGLYNLLLGKHQAFIGQHVRIWDAIAFLPILHHYGFFTSYSLLPDGLTFVASKNNNMVAELSEPLVKQEHIYFTHFYPEVKIFK